MEEFIEAIELKFSTDFESVLKNALAARYSLDDIIEIVYLFVIYTENSFVNRKKFMESGHYIGLKELVSEMHVIRFQYERYKKNLVKQDEGNENA